MNPMIPDGRRFAASQGVLARDHPIWAASHEWRWRNPGISNVNKLEKRTCAVTGALGLRETVETIA
jgi:hypothetical protein